MLWGLGCAVAQAGQGTPQGLSQEQELMLDRCLEEYRANGIGFSQETRMQVAELKNAELQLQRRFMFQLGNKSSKDWILRRSEVSRVSPFSDWFSWGETRLIIARY